ncbi:carbohydrate ABC transporter permease [Truepera radiovictrix]|uniref:Binding-protein-dependent transport systems inner membrane component n=1 Tax=Truepera radiovictrix (strain DSM 17093 / CIP 108686 / LMG 22925 / RQ-24) TaxID=649638 RepID=D7CS71_TRURR|nr:sugar ABC transporter permease [Truepera radiovictrix]ADI13603.1 binding-protein-dependent transport systems inner membrane component [Truepera radiovictrix DSM 17093]WMT57835.1 sugar ABC transporter permease [Truepera radiovictrix]
MRRRFLSPLERRKLALGLLFISPWIVGFLAFTLYPILYTLRISFTRYSGFGEPVWIGLANYRALWSDTVFWQSLGNTLYYTALAVPIGIVVALAMAIAMNQPLKEIPFYRAALYLPSVLPLFAVSFIFIALLDPNRGIVNQLMVSLGLPNINWFGDPRYAKLGLVLLAQLGAGNTALVFLAGLKAIPKTLYEAAVLDGAGPLRRFWSVTLPLMTPVILYSLILGLSLGLQVFAQAYIITNGGPANATNFYVFYLYNQAFRYSQMGVASAMAWVLFVITLVLALLIFRTSKRWVNYETVA